MNFCKNTIGTNALKLPSLGFGAAALGGLFSHVDNKTAKSTLTHALELGLTYVDTAPYYGLGRSERVVGDVLCKKQYILSTKVGRLLKPGAMQDSAAIGWPDALPFHPVFDYTYDGIMRSFEDSQQRLGRDKIDILYVHDIAEETHTQEFSKYFSQLRNGGMKALEQLKKSGNIKAFGIGVNQVRACYQALEIGEWDLFLLAGRYTLLEQNPLDGLFTQCMATNTSIVIGGPYNSGILVGGKTWNYGSAPKQIIEQVKALNAVCVEFNVPLPAAALQFPLAHPVVASVIPGLRSVEELYQTLNWAQVNIPIEFWQMLKDKKLINARAPTPTTNPFFTS
ncbi:MAG: aldo/keto reductase [Rhizobiales bacterium]|nr:aldo/keto reductase [Hyphomicrobiales bacterium]